MLPVPRGLRVTKLLVKWPPPVLLPLVCGALLWGCGGSPATGGTRPAADGSAANKGAMSLDVASNWTDQTPATTSLATIGPPTGSNLQLMKSGSSLRFVFTSDAGTGSTVDVCTNGWQAGEAHTISMAWNGGTLTVYVDGKLAGETQYDGIFTVPPGTPVFIASQSPFGCAVKNLQVWDSPLAAGDLPLPAGTGAAPTTVRVNTVIAGADGTANVCVSLSDSHGVVAGMQDDLAWDQSCAQLAGPCQVDPATGKMLASALLPGGALRSLVFSATNVDPIPDGTLFCCPFRLTTDAAGTCCAITTNDTILSDPGGRLVPAETVEGAICAPAPCSQ